MFKAITKFAHALTVGVLAGALGAALFGLTVGPVAATAAFVIWGGYAAHICHNCN